MSRGRGNAIAVSVLLMGMLLHCCGNVWAATYTVGDAGGWAFNVVSWPNGKTFRAGDVLVFNYNPASHNVFGVGKHGYDTCTAAGQKFQTGSDKITLVKGFNYFICGFPGHCASNMKIAVNAM